MAPLCDTSFSTLLSTLSPELLLLGSCPSIITDRTYIPSPSPSHHPLTHSQFVPSLTLRLHLLPLHLPPPQSSASN
ncbi:hypothetical protein K440DRAFT_630259 [Wilcoxina mikolae CBS 423.85]|nr:hypothetical protein K440DRAFT_630259 [Wilcoxina mikolae CBS 423.85]